MRDVQGKNVIVIGAGRSGRAAARLAADLGADVLVSESRGRENVPAEFQQWCDEGGAGAEYGRHSRDKICAGDLIIVSPGVRRDAEPLVWAREAGIPVIGEMEFAFSRCPARVIAVTGSNGKTTVTTLIGRALEQAGEKVCVCGNIGFPLSEYIHQLTPEHIVVLEVSSFQLETVETFRPWIGLCLNITQNHLDRHADMAEYTSLKQRLFQNQTAGDIAILNDRDPVVREFAENCRAEVVFFNTPEQRDRTGWDHPNYLAAAAAVEGAGLDLSICRQVFEDFAGLEHRLEDVRELNGVTYINDSKSTTLEASRWALESQDRPVVWICGGRDKGLDYSSLTGDAVENVTLMIIFGEAREKIRQAFLDEVDVRLADDLEQAVNIARMCAHPGQCVLLSPMCASFDMFENYEHRGREFKRLVSELE